MVGKAAPLVGCEAGRQSPAGPMRCFRSRQHKALIESPELAGARKPGLADPGQKQAIGCDVDRVPAVFLVEIRMRMIAEPRLLGEQRSRRSGPRR